MSATLAPNHRRRTRGRFSQSTALSESGVDDRRFGRDSPGLALPSVLGEECIELGLCAWHPAPPYETFGHNDADSEMP